MAQLSEDVDYGHESEEDPLAGPGAGGSDAESHEVEQNRLERGLQAPSMSTPKSATGLATLPAIIEPSSLRAYLAKMCDRNEDNQMFTEEDIMKSEASGPVVYWFSMSDCQIIMARAGLLDFVHIVTDEALQRDPAAPQDCFVAYWVRLEALLALYVSRKNQGVSFFNKSDERMRSVLEALRYQDDDRSMEANTLRKSLGKRVLIPLTADKGDCLVDSCCKFFA